MIYVKFSAYNKDSLVSETWKHSTDNLAANDHNGILDKKMEDARTSLLGSVKPKLDVAFFYQIYVQKSVHWMYI